MKLKNAAASRRIQRVRGICMGRLYLSSVLPSGPVALLAHLRAFWALGSRRNWMLRWRVPDVRFSCHFVLVLFGPEKAERKKSLVAKIFYLLEDVT